MLMLIKIDARYQLAKKERPVNKYEKEIALLRKRIERMERQRYYDNECFTNKYYALLGIVVTMAVILVVIILNIYTLLGVIPELI